MKKPITVRVTIELKDTSEKVVYEGTLSEHNFEANYTKPCDMVFGFTNIETHNKVKGIIKGSMCANILLEEITLADFGDFKYEKTSTDEARLCKEV